MDDRWIDDFEKLNLSQHEKHEQNKQSNHFIMRESEEIVNEDNSRPSNPLFYELVSLEVANYFCRYYFDDEDFIHLTFELPVSMMEEIAHSNIPSLFDYLNNTLDMYYFKNKISLLEGQNEEDRLTDHEQSYFILYSNILYVYEQLSYYYLTHYHETEPNVEKFDHTFTDKVRAILSDVNVILEEYINDNVFNYLCNYNIEVLYGCRLILSKLKELYVYFGNSLLTDTPIITPILGFIHGNKNYVKSTLNMINNLCVILIYLKFYYLIYKTDDIEKQDNEPDNEAHIQWKD